MYVYTPIHICIYVYIYIRMFKVYAYVYINMARFTYYRIMYPPSFFRLETKSLERCATSAFLPLRESFA